MLAPTEYSSGVRLRVALILTAVLLGGCFLDNASPTKRLADAVHEMNDSARWGRIGAAANFVDASYRQDFMRSHRRWGRSIKLADGEVLSVEFSPERDSAEAIVTYSWYDLETMTLHDTVVRQHWQENEDFYGLSGETVIGGDPRLFAMAGPSEKNIKIRSW